MEEIKAKKVEVGQKRIAQVQATNAANVAAGELQLLIIQKQIEDQAAQDNG